ncbi:hypothetical protein V2J09_023735 [Rumex salicifolius]
MAINTNSQTTTTTKLSTPPRPPLDVEQQPFSDEEVGEGDGGGGLFDYAKRAQWLRAAVLGANDGLVSTGSLMMGVGAVKSDVRAMILTGFAGLVAGACSMAIGEFVSVYSQLDIERAQMDRERRHQMGSAGVEIVAEPEEEEGLPNPFQAAAASAFSFSLGAMVPLLAAGFVSGYRVRLVAVVAAVTVALVGFGLLGAKLGKAPAARSCLRALFGGWIAMGVTFGLTKLVGSNELATGLFDYAKRAQWLRAAILGANDGLLSTASLMMGVGAVKEDIKAMILTGFVGLIGGALSMAIGEFVSVYSQLDIERAQMMRQTQVGGPVADTEEEEGLPNPFQAAAASAIAFSGGAVVPLMAAMFIRAYKARLVAVVVAVTVALAAFGWLGAVLGKAPTVRSSLRVLIGGWVAMGVTFGLTKFIGSTQL